MEIKNDKINLQNIFGQEVSIFIRREITDILNQFIFNINCKNSRKEIKWAVEDIMRRLKHERGVYNYRVICDETNNSTEVIDNNNIIIDVSFEPVKSVVRHMRITVGPGFHGHNKSSKETKGQVFCEVDPYGEENWEE